MYDLARLGFILLGLYISLSALLAFIASSVGAFSAARSSWDAIGGSLALAIAYAALGLIPGSLLLAANRKLARWCFPEGSPPDLASPDVLVAAGISVVGAYLLASGTADAIGAGLTAVAGWTSASEPLRSIIVGNSVSPAISGVLRVALGFASLYYSQRLSKAFSMLRSGSAA